MRTSPVCLACLSWPEVLEEVFIWLESVVSVLLCTKCGLFYKSCYSKLKVLLWRSKKKMFIAAAAAAKSLQACLTLCDPIDSSPPDSSVPGILQARILEWVAISFSNAWKWKVREVAQSCPTLSDPMDCSPPGSSIHGTFQARVNVLYMLESVTQMWVLDVFLLLRCSDGVSQGAKMGVMAREEWARWVALLNCLVSLKTKMSGCMWQLLLDAFKFMTLQQGPSRWRCGGMYYLQRI